MTFVGRYRHLPIVAGVALGVASFCADLVGGLPGAVLQWAASTGFAWGCLALVVAFAARTRSAAIGAAMAVLGLATVCYYGLNLAGDRWRAAGLGPVLTALAYWLLLSVLSGAVLGVLAHTVRTDPTPRASAAAGLACGLLAGAGIAVVVTLVARGVDERARVVEGALQAMAGIAVATWMFGRRRGPRSWVAYATSALVACTAAALAWSAVESVPVVGF